jgi:hypothetical protein
MKTHEQIEVEIMRLIEELPTGKYDSSAVRHLINILHALDKLIHGEEPICERCLIEAVHWITDDRFGWLPSQRSVMALKY